MVARILLALALALTLPAAQEARQSRQGELLEIWALSQGLATDQALARIQAFRPDEANLRLYLIVRSQILEDKQKDLLQARPTPQNPELDQLKAEVTGCASAIQKWNRP